MHLTSERQRFLKSYEFIPTKNKETNIIDEEYEIIPHFNKIILEMQVETHKNQMK